MTSDLLVERIISRVLRVLLSKTVSKKRISQEFFQKLSVDHRRNGVFHIKPSSTSIALQARAVPKQARVVFVGGSDYDISDISELQSRPEIVWFVQNLIVPQSENVKPLPIGVEGLKWARAGMPWNFASYTKFQDKKDAILVGPFSKTHPEREALISVGNESFVQAINGFRSSFRYAREASKYKFVACPRGNGRDTHRVWETIYRGSIPVVISDSWSRNFFELGVPMVLISSWEELDSVFISHLRDSASRPPKLPSFMRPSFWNHLVSDL